MFKRIVSLIVVVSTLFICSYQAFGEQNPVLYSLSLEQAKTMATEYSPELECWDINKQNLQIQLNSAKITQHENKNTPVYVSQNYDLIFVKEGYYVETVNSQLRLSDLERTKIIASIAYDVTQKYYNAKNAAKMCEITASALARAEENKSVIQKRYELGLCTELELENADIAVKQCKASAEKCVNSLTLAEESLKIVLGIEDNSTLILTDEIDYSEFKADLEGDISKGLSSRYDIHALRENVHLSEMYFDIVSGLSEKSTTYFSAYTNDITSKYNLTTGEKNIVLLIKNSYFAAVDAQNNADIAKEKLEFARNSYEINKIRYELGMITGIALSSSSDELASAENAYESALLSLKLAAEKYNYEVQIGI